VDGIDVEGRRWRAGKLDDAFPKALEAEEELDFFAAEESANWFHGALGSRDTGRVELRTAECGWGGVGEVVLACRSLWGERIRMDSKYPKDYHTHGTWDYQ
ncbi:hypothetical protein OAF84_05155, partial [Akkermansiaceae bacterium]|nr:hypothetical protein [Akkermansiaceae bacterium]